MKIAIVLNTSWNIYNFRMGLIRSFLEKGYEVYAIAPRDKYSVLLENEGCKFVEVKMDSRGANPVKDIGLIYELYSIYRKVRPDVVLHFTIKPNIYGTIAARLLKIPAINNVCGLGTIFLTNNLTSRIAIIMYKIAFRYPKNIFFQNEEDLNLFLEKKLASPDICRLIPGSGIDLGKFKPRKMTSNKKFTFLLVARLIHDKGVIEYVEAVKRLKIKGLEADFKLIGAKDPLHKRGIPLSLIEEWTNNKIIDYLGVTDDIMSSMEKVDCVVLPSYREGAPRTLLEAASLAKPIIATNVPGCRQVVVDKENGLLCKVKDAEDLADKMERMMTLERDHLKTMGNNGRKRMEQLFDEKIIIDKYHSQIEEVHQGTWKSKQPELKDY